MRESKGFGRVEPTEGCSTNTAVSSPSTGFYEFQGENSPKYTVALLSTIEGAFCAHWTVGHLEKTCRSLLTSFTIIVREPNDFVRSIHDRMPVILRREDEEKWLDCATTPFEKAQSVPQQFPSDLMDAHVMSTRVDSALYNPPGLWRAGRGGTWRDATAPRERAFPALLAIALALAGAFAEGAHKVLAIA